MFSIIQTIGQVLALVLCLFSLVIIYLLFHGEVEGNDKLSKRLIGGQVLGRISWATNGLRCLWIALQHRKRLWRLVELSEAGEFIRKSEMQGRYTDTGNVITLLEGMVVVTHLLGGEEGKTLYIRRPFEFLERNWRETIRDGIFRRNKK